MKVMDKLHQMTPQQFAEFLHIEINKEDCPGCILNNLNKLEFCTADYNCKQNITSYLNSEAEI